MKNSGGNDPTNTDVIAVEFMTVTVPEDVTQTRIKKPTPLIVVPLFFQADILSIKFNIRT